MTTINLDNIDIFKYDIVYTGKKRGILARVMTDILQISKIDDIEIVIPDRIMSITPSFLEAFLLTVYEYGGQKAINAIKFTTKLSMESDIVEVLARLNNSVPKLESDTYGYKFQIDKEDVIIIAESYKDAMIKAYELNEFNNNDWIFVGEVKIIICN